MVVRTRVLWPQPRAAFANRRPVIYGSEYKGFFINSVRPNRPSAIPFGKPSPTMSCENRERLVADKINQNWLSNGSASPSGVTFFVDLAV